MTLRAPFPYFGGKRRAADLIWSRLGAVENYVEPFFGSGAVLLARANEPKIETVNDKHGYLANFWRAVQQHPAIVARYADGPVNEADLHARHRWLVQRGLELHHDVRSADLYAEESATISADVRRWAIEHGDDPRLRIALCGYEGEHEMPATWECVPWKANGGYGNAAGNGNKHRERVWFSPACLRPAEQRGAQMGLCL